MSELPQWVFELLNFCYVTSVKGLASFVNWKKARFVHSGWPRLGAGGRDQTGDQTMTRTPPLPFGHGFPHTSACILYHCCCITDGEQKILVKLDLCKLLNWIHLKSATTGHKMQYLSHLLWNKIWDFSTLTWREIINYYFQRCEISSALISERGEGCTVVANFKQQHESAARHVAR